jgi:hypothetical protein
MFRISWLAFGNSVPGEIPLIREYMMSRIMTYSTDARIKANSDAVESILASVPASRTMAVLALDIG